MISIATPPDNTPDNTDNRLSPFQRVGHSRSTQVFFGKIFNLFKQFLQETVACHRACDVFHAAAALNPILTLIDQGR
jgi:hypothetical protein